VVKKGDGCSQVVMGTARKVVDVAKWLWVWPSGLMGVAKCVDGCGQVG
jgi:hypothetical protein